MPSFSNPEKNQDLKAATELPADDKYQENQRIAENEEEIESALKKKEGLNLDEAEYRELSSVLPAFASEAAPKFQEFLEKNSSKIEQVINLVNDLKSHGKEDEALEKTTDFLDEEVKLVDQIDDPKAKEQIMGYLNIALDLAKAKDQMDAKMKSQIISTGLDIVPVVGSGKMITEAAIGKTMGGEQLSGGKRAMHAVEGVTFLALDGIAIAGLATGGVVTAGAEGTKVAVAGARTAEAGVQVARTVTRFAALLRKTERFRNASRTVYKVGMFLKKYPKLTGTIVRLAKSRKMETRAANLNKIKQFSVDKHKAPLAFHEDLNAQAQLADQKAEAAKKSLDKKNINDLRASLGLTRDAAANNSKKGKKAA